MTSEQRRGCGVEMGADPIESWSQPPRLQEPGTIGHEELELPLPAGAVRILIEGEGFGEVLIHPAVRSWALRILTGVGAVLLHCLLPRVPSVGVHDLLGDGMRCLMQEDMAGIS